jgi:hypothetical protein
MSETITLHIKDVFVACKKALDEGRLSAFANPENKACAYRDNKGFPCAVGAGISDEDYKKLIETHGLTMKARDLVILGPEDVEDNLNNTSIMFMSKYGTVKLVEDGVFDMYAIDSLQGHHDHIVRSRYITRKKSEKNFLAFLDSMLDKL